MLSKIILFLNFWCSTLVFASECERRLLPFKVNEYHEYSSRNISVLKSIFFATLAPGDILHIPTKEYGFHPFQILEIKPDKDQIKIEILLNSRNNPQVDISYKSIQKYFRKENGAFYPRKLVRATIKQIIPSASNRRYHNLVKQFYEIRAELKNALVSLRADPTLANHELTANVLCQLLDFLETPSLVIRNADEKGELRSFQVIAMPSSNKDKRIPSIIPWLSRTSYTLADKFRTVVLFDTAYLVRDPKMSGLFLPNQEGNAIILSLSQLDFFNTRPSVVFIHESVHFFAHKKAYGGDDTVGQTNSDFTLTSSPEFKKMIFTHEGLFEDIDDVYKKAHHSDEITAFLKEVYFEIARIRRFIKTMPNDSVFINKTLEEIKTLRGHLDTAAKFLHKEVEWLTTQKMINITLTSTNDINVTLENSVVVSFNPKLIHPAYTKAKTQVVFWKYAMHLQEEIGYKVVEASYELDKIENYLVGFVVEK